MMQIARAIPVLLLDGGRLVKSVRFTNPTYIGDPRNALKIFNDRGADELLLLDITATTNQRAPNLDLVEEIVSEAFMPVAYGGGIRDRETARRIVASGVEKVVLGAGAVEVAGLVEELAGEFGSSSTVVCVDVVKTMFRQSRVAVRRASVKVQDSPVEFAQRMVERGAGELIVQSVDRDGCMCGYDLALIREVASAVSVPIVACGGAGRLSDLAAATAEGASGAAAGSLFVFRPPHRAVLISYPEQSELDIILHRNW
jgi:cyclase